MIEKIVLAVGKLNSQVKTALHECCSADKGALASLSAGQQRCEDKPVLFRNSMGFCADN